MHPEATINHRLRIGAVSYLNSKPLVRGLAAALPDSVVRYDLASRLADELVAGQLDVALVPIVEYLRQPDFRLVSDACVACRGPVLSVKLFFRTPPSEVRTLALDEGSRTSAALAQILLSELEAVQPELTRLPIGDRLEDSDADAVLLIGDRAMKAPEQAFCEVWDLGDRWCRWTELPFVFAAWVARPGLNARLTEISAALAEVRDAGVDSIDAIVESEAASLGLASQTAHEYLTRNLHFRLGDQEQAGMQRFADLCRDLRLVPGPFPPLVSLTV